MEEKGDEGPLQPFDEDEMTLGDLADLGGDAAEIAGDIGAFVTTGGPLSKLLAKGGLKVAKAGAKKFLSKSTIKEAIIGLETASIGSLVRSGLISAFGLKLVKTGRVPAALGKALNRAAEIRLGADYPGEGVSMEDAQWAVEQAAVFVESIRSMFGIPE